MERLHDYEAEVSDRLGLVLGMTIDGEGHLFVPDNSNMVVWVLGEDGRLLQKVGSEGEGPAEFQMISGVSLGNSDSLYVFDGQLRRVSVFDPGGYNYVRSFSIEGYDAKRPDLLLTTRRDGHVVVLSEPYTAGNLDRPHVLTVSTYDFTGARIPSVELEFPAQEMMVFKSGSNRFSLLQRYPEGRKQIISSSDDGVIYTGFTEEPTIEIYDDQGTVIQTMTWEHTPIPFTEEEREGILESTGEEFRQMRRETFYDTKPAFNAIVVDDQDRAWVQLSWEYGAEEAAWLVFERSGELVGHAMVPVNVMFHAVKGGKAYGVQTRESGEQEIVAYRVAMPAADSSTDSAG